MTFSLVFIVYVDVTCPYNGFNDRVNIKGFPVLVACEQYLKVVEHPGLKFRSAHHISDPIVRLELLYSDKLALEPDDTKL